MTFCKPLLSGDIAARPTWRNARQCKKKKSGLTAHFPQCSVNHLKQRERLSPQRKLPSILWRPSNVSSNAKSLRNFYQITDKDGLLPGLPQWWQRTFWPIPLPQSYLLSEARLRFLRHNLIVFTNLGNDFLRGLSLFLKAKHSFPESLQMED